MAKSETPVPPAPMDMVPYFLRRDPRTKDKGKTVSVNEMRWFIPYNQNVTIPRCIAEVLDNSLAEDDKTAEKIAELSSKAEAMARAI